jgi:hypothetical protein
MLNMVDYGWHGGPYFTMVTFGRAWLSTVDHGYLCLNMVVYN